MRFSATAPCVALTPASLQSYLLLPWSRNFLPLTARNGGNAQGLLGTILALQSYPLYQWVVRRRPTATLAASEGDSTNKWTYCRFDRYQVRQRIVVYTYYKMSLIQLSAGG